MSIIAFSLLVLRFVATKVINFEFLTCSYHYQTAGISMALNARQATDTTVIYETAGDVKAFVHWDASNNVFQRKDPVISCLNSDIIIGRFFNLGMVIFISSSGKSMPLR